MGQRTPLYEEHVAQEAKIVDFAGWDMPIHFGSQIDEHKTVRQSAGMFDVSHMAAVDITGPQARDYLRHLWANDVAKADELGKALYTCMLNERGGVVDDLIVYHLEEQWYRTVLNAATTEKDLAWMQKQAAGFDVEIKHRPDLAIIAVQGPEARERAAKVLASDVAEKAMALKPFRAVVVGEQMVGRTGYTGEDGFEIILPGTQAVGLWQALLKEGVKPIGLGARDTLRLEAGLNLYGQDMDDDHHPLEAGLGWTVDFKQADRNFIGREALEAEKAKADADRFKLVGIVLTARGMIREGSAIRITDAGDDQPQGIITSGGFSPVLERSIGYARVPKTWDEQELEVQMRKKWKAARVVAYPFVKKGKPAVEI